MKILVVCFLLIAAVFAAQPNQSNFQKAIQYASEQTRQLYLDNRDQIRPLMLDVARRGMDMLLQPRHAVGYDESSDEEMSMALQDYQHQSAQSLALQAHYFHQQAQFAMQQAQILHQQAQWLQQAQYFQQQALMYEQLAQNMY